MKYAKYLPDPTVLCALVTTIFASIPSATSSEPIGISPQKTKTFQKLHVFWLEHLKNYKEFGLITTLKIPNTHGNTW